MLEEEKKEEEGQQEGVGVEGQEGSTSGLVKKDTGGAREAQEEEDKSVSSSRCYVIVIGTENLFT